MSGYEGISGDIPDLMSAPDVCGHDISDVLRHRGTGLRCAALDLVMDVTGQAGPNESAFSLVWLCHVPITTGVRNSFAHDTPLMPMAIL